ncbi:hypothetical protein ACFSJU_12050 [Paradesertivirga mongoliensis]|uniref:Uncharacterized protein n=1 Tax=Paradesertivirga mongoliensis TaxID=2100740 RepID=A0ABW4ZM60_9SPHI|nr:hypothetical protein [Pedobacter mongoliensis]
MKPKFLFLFICLYPSLLFCQNITRPAIGYSEDHNTTIKKVEVTASNTVVTFVHTLRAKGAWVQLNKSMYLQDSHGEDRFNYVRSEGIPLRPEKFTADKDFEEVEFKVYFEKLKPGIKEINIIERARSFTEQSSSNISYINFFNVNLYKSAPDIKKVETSVILTPPPPFGDTNTDSLIFNNPMPDFGAMMGSMYSNLLDLQIKTYSNPETLDKLAQITRNYYNALVKAGFSQDSALKIITSKPLISTDFGKQ